MAISPTHQLDDADIYVGDCTEVLSKLDRKIDLIFADPPFNIGHGYIGYDDTVDRRVYRQFTWRWVARCFDVLADHGTMWVNIPDDLVFDIYHAIASAGLIRVNWCIWHYRFGQCGNGRFINSKTHALCFAKDPKRRTWNPDAVLVESDRASTYGDKRTTTTRTPGRRVPLDVWGVPSDGQYWGRIQGGNLERWGDHPNQLPEVYLERVIRSTSNPGDLVLDPFLGSGTTAVVAAALGRRFIGVEICPKTAESAFKRMQRGAVRAGK